MPGPPPKPTKLKRLEGNPGKRKLNTAEPEPAVECPEPPAILRGEAGLEWVRITQLLTELGLIARTDLAVLTTYCVAWGEFLESQEMLNENGSLLVEVGENGSLQPHPALSIRRRAEKVLLAMAGQLGLSPSARTRIHVAKQEEADPLAAFHKKHG